MDVPENLHLRFAELDNGRVVVGEPVACIGNAGCQASDPHTQQLGAHVLSAYRGTSDPLWSSRRHLGYFLGQPVELLQTGCVCARAHTRGRTRTLPITTASHGSVWCVRKVETQLGDAMERTLFCACVDFPLCRGFLLLENDVNARVLLVHDAAWEEAPGVLQQWAENIQSEAFQSCLVHTFQQIRAAGGMPHGVSFVCVDRTAAPQPRKRLRS